MKSQRGDVPVFRDGDVLVCKPKLVNNIKIAVADPCLSGRQPDFTSDDFCHLLYVLTDCRITGAVEQLLRVKSRAEMDREFSNPWSDSITPLFNDKNFQPALEAVL